MTVKEVFDLRKQGKTEEAYAAIRPMYAVHKGKYTTLCMFWVGSDMLKKRLTEHRGQEAVKIFEALLRVQRDIDDRDGKVHEAIVNDLLKLGDHVPQYSMLDFIAQYGVAWLKEEDWQTPLFALQADASPTARRTPPAAMRLLTRCFYEVKRQPTAEQAVKIMPLLQEAVRRNPLSKSCLRCMAMVYRIMGEKEKAIRTYELALTRYHESYLFSELAELTDDPGERAALYCRAIENQW